MFACEGRTEELTAVRHSDVSTRWRFRLHQRVAVDLPVATPGRTRIQRDGRVQNVPDSVDTAAAKSFVVRTDQRSSCPDIHPDQQDRSAVLSQRSRGAVAEP